MASLGSLPWWRQENADLAESPAIERNGGQLVRSFSKIRPGRYSSSTVLFVAAAAGVVIAVVLSPLALPLVASRREDWQELSNVGQAYGGIAAVLSGLAFLGIIISLALQRRQTKIQQG